MSLRQIYPLTVGPTAMPTGAAAAVYTAKERVIIREWTFANTTAGALAVTLNKVSATGTASVGNQLIPALSLPANDVQVIQAPLVLEAGERVFGLAAGAVNLMFIVNDRESVLL